jgi:hypothetical protein
MRYTRAVFVLVMGVLCAGSWGHALAASHPAAAQEKKVEKPAAPAVQRHVGTMKAGDAAAGTLTVSEKNSEVTLSVGEETAIKKGRKNVMLKDLRAGDEAIIRHVTGGGKDVVRSVMIRAKK